MKNFQDWAKVNTLDVIFAQRNKSYGAYDLRHRYRKHALSGLLLSAFLFVFGFGVYASMERPKSPEMMITFPDDSKWVNPDKPTPPPDIEKPPPQVEKPKPVAKVIQFLVPKIVENEKVKQELPTLETLRHVVTGVQTSYGADTEPEYVAPSPIVAPQDSPVDKPIEPPPPLPPPADDAPLVEEDQGPSFVEVPDIMPAPIGGLQSLQARIVYPEMARRARIEGRVVVRFIVDEIGNVTQPEVLVGIGGGCDEEAIRVIQLTQFTPGNQRGRPVKVRMSIPIRFRLN